MVENSGVENEVAFDGPCVWIYQQLGWIPALAPLGIPRAVYAESVSRTVAYTRDASMEDVVQAIGKFDAMFCGPVENAEFDAIGAFGPQCDVRAAIGMDANAERVPPPTVEGRIIQSSAFPVRQHERTVSGSATATTLARGSVVCFGCRDRRGMSGMAEFVEVSVDAGVATIRMDRPPMNALNSQVQREIAQAAQEVAGNAQVGAVVVFGGPKVFAAGADIAEMSSMTYADMAAASRGLRSAFSTVARIPQPTIAAITGYALGGGLELAMCCDFRVAGDNAKVGQPEIALGIIPGAGGTQRLPRLIGPARAKDLVFSGRFVDAQEALAIGLVDRVCAPDDVYSEAVSWARALARGPRIALQAAKAAIDTGLEVDLETGLEIERAHFSALFATDDQRIGMESFLANGPGQAEFTGR